MEKSVLILGATGGVGGAVARAMQARGWQVVALVRDEAAAQRGWTGTPGVRWIAGDAMVAGDVLRAAQGCSVVVHAVNPPGYRDWDRLVLPMIDNTLAAARAHGARVVLPGTVYNFDPAQTPLVDADTPQNPRGRKGAVRVEMERRIVAAAPAVRSLIVRAGDFFGPGVRQSWFAQALAAAPLRRIVNPGRQGVGHAWAYLPDLADAIAGLLDLPEGRLADAERVQFSGFWDHDGRQMIDLIRRVSQQPKLPVVSFPWWLMRLASPFGGFPREVGEVAPFWRYPMRFDGSRMAELLGDVPATPVEVAVARAIGHG